MRIDTISPTVPVEIECDGYVPLVVRYDGYKGPTSMAPKYWRTGDFKHTLIEVAVNPSSGAICKMVVTSLRPLQSEPIAINVPSNKTGMPCVSMSQWANDQERVDIEQDVTASLVDRELTVVFGKVEPTSLKRIVCDRMTFLINHFDEFRGITVGNLSEQEVANILYATGQTSA